MMKIDYTVPVVSGGGSLSTFPYVSFMGQALSNHSYVDLSTVGYSSAGIDSVQCHTDLTTCCSGSQGFHRGDWYFPDGTRLPFASSSVPIGEGRAAQRVVIPVVPLLLDQLVSIAAVLLYIILLTTQ